MYIQYLNQLISPRIFILFVTKTRCWLNFPFTAFHFKGKYTPIVCETEIKVTKIVFLIIIAVHVKKCVWHFISQRTSQYKKINNVRNASHPNKRRFIYALKSIKLNQSNCKSTYKQKYFFLNLYRTLSTREYNCSVMAQRLREQVWLLLTLL